MCGYYVFCRRVYLIRATVASTNMVANHINNSLSTSTDKISYRIVFVPRMVSSVYGTITKNINKCLKINCEE